MRRGAAFVMLLITASFSCESLFDNSGEVGVRWSVPIDAGEAVPLTYAAVGDGVVVFPLSGELRAYDTRSGDEKWTRSIGRPDPRNVLYSGEFLAASGISAAAIDAEGGLSWARTLEGDGSDGRTDADDVSFYVAEAGGFVHAFDRASGSTLWRVDLSVDSATATAIHGLAADGTRVFVAREGVFPLGIRTGAIIALDASDGHIEWESRVPPGPSGRSTIIDAPLLAGEFVIGSDMHSNAVIALRTLDGSAAWRWQGDVGWVGPARSPVHADGVLYFGSGDTHVYALRLDDGSEVWSRHLESSVNQVALCGERLLVDRGTLEILAQTSGAHQAQFLDHGDQFVVGGLVVHNRIAYFAAYDRLIALACDDF